MGCISALKDYVEQTKASAFASEFGCACHSGKFLGDEVPVTVVNTPGVGAKDTETSGNIQKIL